MVSLLERSGLRSEQTNSMECCKIFLSFLIEGESVLEMTFMKLFIGGPISGIF